MPAESSLPPLPEAEHRRQASVPTQARHIPALHTALTQQTSGKRFASWAEQGIQQAAMPLALDHVVQARIERWLDHIEVSGEVGMGP
jgi:hypothetical protein